jgi:hypothetical protein
VALAAMVPASPAASTSARRRGALVAATALATLLNPLLAPVLAGTACVAPALAPGAARARVGLARRLAEATRGAPLRWTAAGAALGAALCLVENALRRGAPLDFGYGGEGFTTPALAGLAGLLFAPARGLVFFAPAFFLGIALAVRPPREMPAAAATFTRAGLVYCVLLVGAYAKWHAWHGGWYWGPRFLLPLSVLGAGWAALALRYAWREAAPPARVLVVGLVAASALVVKAGEGVGQGPLVRCLERAVPAESCFWRLEFLPYASYGRSADLAAMIRHRSTPVEGAGIALLGLLAAAAPRSGESRGTPAPRPW